MTFTTSIFLIGLLPWLALLFALLRNKNKARIVLIFLANSIFYLWGGVGSFFVIGIISIVTWIFCRICKDNKIVLTVGYIVIITPLVFVKYASFLIESINALFGYEISIPNMLVPIGISFFTFEAISCLYDVYKNKFTEKISLLEVYLYLTFFPTVTSGPIIRFSNFKLGLLGEVNLEKYNESIERIAIGLWKKVLIADKVAVLADYYFNGVASGNTYSALGLWIGSIAYTLQIYFDFSGYSDMAIGIGRLIGFDIPENFNKPYQANSIQDFWKRWHISLSVWFRDYVYIPLGGNRCSVSKHIFNLSVVWLLTGIWHGADWSFVIWGGGYLLLLIAEKYIKCIKKIEKCWYGHLYTLFFVNMLWIPFRASNLNVTGKYLAGMFGANGMGALEEKAINFLPYIIFAIIMCFPCNKLFEKLDNRKWFRAMKGILMLAMTGLALCAVINASYTPYIYGNF